MSAEVIRRILRGPIRKTPPDPAPDPTIVKFGRVEGRPHGDPALLMHPPVEQPDDYFWMRDDAREDERVLKHLRQENMYTNYRTLGVRAFAKRVYKEMLSHYLEDDTSVPAKKGAFVYYEKTVSGKSYAYYCRKALGEGGELGEEEILLDVNALAVGQKHCDVGATEVSPEGYVLAYSIDLKGYETYELRFLDLRTGALLEKDTVPGTAGGVEWGKDGGEVYYTTFDDAHRPCKVWRHVLVSGPVVREGAGEDDVSLAEERDKEFGMYVGKSLSGRFLAIGSWSSTSSEMKIFDLERPEDGVRVFREREEDVLYHFLHAGGDKFYVVTNAGCATNFKVMQADLGDTGVWTEFLPYDADRKVDDVRCFKNFAVLSGREKGYSEIWIIPQHNPALIYQLPLEEPAHVVSSGTNLEFDTGKFRYGYSSLTTPSQVFDYDVATKKTELIKEKEVPNYDRSIYKTERIEAESVDGVKIPISLVYNSKAISTDGPNLLHLYGYGSYEVSIDPQFAMSRLPLLDRGVVYAIAHVRGGGEYGRQWYEAARFENKKKTFEDFCACAEKLVADKRTTPDLMSMEGRSAGGLLVGAVMNMRPDLFKAVIAGVPFVDVLNTMSDPTIPLTTGEWQEWGNPHMKKYFEAMKEYCPYTNVGPKKYPATLILAGLHDPRVMYSEPAKWAAKLRAHTTGTEPILLKVDMSSGHFSASNRYSYLRERSFELAWLLRQVGALDDPVAVAE